jgi:hypothetical protein
VNPFILLRGVVNWWLLTSQTSSSLASKVLNFWILSLDQVMVILLSIVNVTSKFLEDKEWFKFGIVMTVSHSLFLESFYDIFEFTSKLKQQEKQEKTEKRASCHDY